MKGYQNTKNGAADLNDVSYQSPGKYNNEPIPTIETAAESPEYT